MEMGGTYTKERPLKCDPPSLGLEPAREEETRMPQADMEAEHHGRVKEDQSDMGNSKETHQGPWKMEADCCGTMLHKESRGLGQVSQNT